MGFYLDFKIKLFIVIVGYLTPSLNYSFIVGFFFKPYGLKAFKPFLVCVAFLKYNKDFIKFLAVL